MTAENIYAILLPAEFIFGFVTLISLLTVSAPYGRFVRAGWGPVVKALKGWVIMEIPAVAVMAYWFFTQDKTVISVILIIIWQSHYLRRTFHYPFQMKGREKPFPVILVVMAIFFNTMNGFINGYYLFDKNPYTTAWLSDPKFIGGAVIFYAGYWINVSSDRLLSRLERGPNNEYVIPEGGLFNRISCPHYFGEIVQWTGWAILTWSWAGAAFAFFTFANLAPRALSHHKWYREHFRDYPQNRKALIPYLV